MLAATICLAGMLDMPAVGQTSDSAPANANPHSSAKRDIGGGAGDIGKGAAKGVGNAAKGTGEAAGDLVTLHPVKGATNLGKGAARAGKDVGVGSVKGTGKIVRGAGKAIKHVF